MQLFPFKKQFDIHTHFMCFRNLMSSDLNIKLNCTLQVNSCKYVEALLKSHLVASLRDFSIQLIRSRHSTHFLSINNFVMCLLQKRYARDSVLRMKSQRIEIRITFKHNDMHFYYAHTHRQGSIQIQRVEKRIFFSLHQFE